MTPEEDLHQSEIHDVLQLALMESGELLTGWVICYEYRSADDPPSCGHVYGPGPMTTWGALGLVEWARKNTLTADEDDPS